MKKKFTIYVISFLAIAGMFFGWGFFSGKKGVFPHDFLLETRHAIWRDVNPSASWMHLAFARELHGGTLKTPAITSPGQIKDLVAGYVASNEDLSKFDTSLTLGKLSRDNNIANLPFKLAGNSYTAHAYFRPAAQSADRGSCAAVILPPHREHASYRIAESEKGFVSEVPEGLMGRITRYCDGYAVIRPNHGYLSIHDGTKKLRFIYLEEVAQTNFPGASTGGYVIAGTAALIKTLSAQYRKVILMGLSEGSILSQFVSILAKPDLAIMASGFSLLWSQATGKEGTTYAASLDHHVFHLPDFVKRIQESQTRFVYSFGRRETGVLGVEARTNYTCGYLSRYPNVECLTHDHGHIFPTIEIEKLVKRELNAS